MSEMSDLGVELRYGIPPFQFVLPPGWATHRLTKRGVGIGGIPDARCRLPRRAPEAHRAMGFGVDAPGGAPRRMPRTTDRMPVEVVKTSRSHPRRGAGSPVPAP